MDAPLPLVQAGTSTINALKIIDEGPYQIALVVDSTNKLLGTVTDGDIRRGLISGVSLQHPVGELMNTSFRYATTTDSASYIDALMCNNLLRQIPILDSGGRVERIVLLQDPTTVTKIETPVVIMAGGQGTRLRPKTLTCPKPMLRISGRPILELIIDNCKKVGLFQFYISVNYLKEHIIDYFGDGSGHGVEIKYLVESEPLGTAGSLSLLPSLDSQQIIIMNGDILTTVDYRNLLEYHRSQHCHATMCVRQHQSQLPFGVVNVKDGAVLSLIEKPTQDFLVNAGIYVLETSCLTSISRDQSVDMPSILCSLVAEQKRVSAFPIHEQWIDIGRPDSLDAANNTLHHFMK